MLVLLFAFRRNMSLDFFGEKSATCLGSSEKLSHAFRKYFNRLFC
jgi:hypothetical protein